jgi:phosphopantothenoylcysteine decarboxylase/phosphopantothenate--cysteine ligase
VLLIVGGGIAAYKSLELIRLLTKAGARVRPVLTAAAAQFVTPSVALGARGRQGPRRAVRPDRRGGDGAHPALRAAELVVVAPATADLMAKAAQGPRGRPGEHAAARDRQAGALRARDERPHVGASGDAAQPGALRGTGRSVVGPGEGEMACGEYGAGRMAEPAEIAAAVAAALGTGALGGPARARDLRPDARADRPGALHRQPLVRAAGRARGGGVGAARRAGELRHRPGGGAAALGCEIVEVETAAEMLEAVEAALPAEAAVFAAAVADWRASPRAPPRSRRTARAGPPALELAENPDILRAVARAPRAAPLVVGFAAETDDVVANATAKRLRKGCDWIVANDVSPASGVMGGTENAVILVTEAGPEIWPRMSKEATAERLADRIAEALA